MVVVPASLHSWKDLEDGPEAVYEEKRMDFDLEGESERMFVGETLVR